ncbi:MAG: hypothetical protein JW719_12075, partial [Pirellulales bacterium]|nr:hypothetical protein [Pirellulales bacterium]
VGRREAARAALAAARICVRIEAESDLDVETDQADSPGRRRIDQGASVEIAGEGIAEFRIAGVGRFRASGPTASIVPLRGELDQAEREVRTLVEGLPTADPTDLEQLHEQAIELDRKISAAEARLHGLLDGRTFESLDAERKTLAGTVGQIEAEFADWAATPPDADALAAGARQMQQQFDADRDALERRGRQCDAAVLVAEGELADVGRRLDDRRARLEKVQQRLASLLGEKNADEAAGDLQDQRRRRAMAAEAARGRLDETQQALAEFTGDPNEEARQIERRADLARSELQRLCEEDSRLKGQLETLQAESPYTALAEADEQIARLEEAIAAERLRNDAIRLLFETFRDCRNEAVEAVSEPVGARATELLRRITGAPLGAVRFTPSFLPEHLVPEGLDRPRSIEETSGGEQEQVHLAVRLALADVLAGDERQLIVLDDVLTATDSGRLANILQLLDEAAERYQMLILTCHPERYRALERARFFDLKAICQDVLEPRMDTDEHG